MGILSNSVNSDYKQLRKICNKIDADKLLVDRQLNNLI